MSVNAIEMAFWKIGSSPVEVQQYLADKDDYLSTFNLSTQERQLVQNLDVRALAEKGVNTVLLVNTYSALCGGPASLGEYLQKMAAAN